MVQVKKRWNNLSLPFFLTKRIIVHIIIKESSFFKFKLTQRKVSKSGINSKSSVSGDIWISLSPNESIGISFISGVNKEKSLEKVFKMNKFLIWRIEAQLSLYLKWYNLSQPQELFPKVAAYTAAFAYYHGKVFNAVH